MQHDEIARMAYKVFPSAGCGRWQQTGSMNSTTTPSVNLALPAPYPSQDFVEEYRSPSFSVGLSHSPFARLCAFQRFVCGQYVRRVEPSDFSIIGVEFTTFDKSKACFAYPAAMP